MSKWETPPRMVEIATSTLTLFLNHYAGSTQHETLPVVSPGSLHMNTSIENMCTQSLLKRRFLNNSP